MMDKIVMLILISLAQRARRARNEYRKIVRKCAANPHDAELYQLSLSYYATKVASNNAFELAKALRDAERNRQQAEERAFAQWEKEQMYGK